MFMKKEYKKPVLAFTELTEAYGILKGDSGEANTGDMESKKGDFEEDNETGIPNTFTNVWGDENEE